MKTTAHTPTVTIIGAGIVGICCALSLLEKNLKVRLLDRAAPGQGASFGNAGVISPWSCVPQAMPGLWKNLPLWLLDPEGPVAIRPRYALAFLPWAVRFLRAGRVKRVRTIAAAMDALNRPNVGLYRYHLAGTGQEDLLRDSCYIHVSRQAPIDKLEGLAWQLRAAHGAPVEAIDAHRLREIEPALAHDYKAAVLIKDQARALSPGQIGQVLAEKVRALGGEIQQAAVHKLVPRNTGGWHLTSDAGQIESHQVVLAAGAWSAKLLKTLGLRVPLEAERGYHLVFQNPGVNLNHSVMDVEAKFVASSMATGLRSAGTAEFAGLDVAPDYRRAQIFKRLSKRMIPALNTDQTSEWMGTRPSFPDSLPCIGEIPGYRGLFAAFGHSHYGLGMAPMTGRVIADLVTGAPPQIDLAPYAVNRFTEKGRRLYTRLGKSPPPWPSPFTKGRGGIY